MLPACPFLFGLILTGAIAQEPADEPALRLEAGGPTSLVTSLAFAPDGRTLYEAGWDKVVRVWTREGDQAFQLDAPATYRVPIGPGTLGAINAMALSPDGEWLAVAGNGVMREGAGFRQPGLVVPTRTITDAMRREQGTIHVFRTRGDPRTARALRGHLGPVFGLAFAPSSAGKPPLLLSAGREREQSSAVKLWDVESGEALRSLSWKGDVEARPGLALWHDGDARTDVRAAVAWQDGWLRLWDIGAQPPERSVNDGLQNNTAVYLPDRDLLLTASFQPDARQAVLRGWTPAEGAAPRPDERRQFRFPAAEGQVEAPRALAVFPSRPGGPLDRAAVVLLRAPLPGSPGRRELSLALVELRDDGFRSIGPRLTLWPDAGITPTLAASPDGRTLAVAGSPDREVRVYNIAEILDGKDDPQRLRGAGSTSRRVAFVRKGDAWGLRLDDGLIFDAEARRLTDEQEGWNVSGPQAGTWRLGEPQPLERDASGRVVRWSVPVQGGPPAQVRLEIGQSVTATALRPPAGPGRRPLVAIATMERGEPVLGLFDGATGALIRRLTGHVEPIADLGFSGDGRLLASAAEDRTINVWSLTDLDATWDRLRLLRGVSAFDRDGRLVVGGVDPARAAGLDLREGDVLRGVVEPDGRRVRPLASFADLKEALSARAPGQVVNLLRSRGEGRPGYVAARLEQGADERKPLFSLFITRDDGAGRRSWIGWSPLGPYETSDRDVERLLGWHVNTGQPEAPARFALADQYRDRFYREGLLRDLIAHGALVPPQPPPPLPRPGISLLLDPPGVLDDRNQVVLRGQPRALGLTIAADRPPDDRIASVRWQLGEGESHDLVAVGQGLWRADVSESPWGRGIHRVRAILRTNESSPQEFIEEQFVRLQPPRPEIDADPPVTPVLEAPTYRFRARVLPVGGPADVRLIRRVGNAERVEKTWEGVAEPLTIDEEVKLDEGPNAMELVAVNVGALAGYEEEETARWSMSVNYSRRPVPPPRITLSTVTTVGGGQPVPVVGDGPIVVDAPRVRLEGRIEGESPLSHAERLDDRAPEGRPLDGFAADREKVFAISEVLDLVPGAQTVRLRARAADSEAGEARLTINYRPRLPVVADLELDPPGAILDGEPGQPPPPLRLKARLLLPTDTRPFRATILIHDRELAEPPEIDAAAGTLQATIPLQPGDNAIRVRLENEWGALYTTEQPIHVRYRRLPKLVNVERPEVGDRPVVGVRAVVASWDDLPIKRARVEVEGGGGLSPTIRDDVAIRREGDAWAVEAGDVPLFEGSNTLRVWAWNADGRSVEPGLVAGLTYRKPPPARPFVEFLDPARDLQVERPELAVRFRVRSESPLRRVELVREPSTGERTVLHALDVAGIEKDDRGEFAATVTTTVALHPGANHLRLVAVNDGGESIAPLVLSYVPAPVRLLIDRVVPKSGRGPSVAPVVSDARVEFPEPIAEGQAWLEGRVVWPDEASQAAAPGARAMLWVNGFPQVPAPLQADPARSRERTFRAPIVLNGERTHVEIDLPDLPRVAEDRTEFDLACREPETRQRLHLLIIGVGEESEVALRDRVLDALHGRLVEGSTNLFQTPAFREGKIYGPLAGDVRQHRVLGELLSINDAIRLRPEVDAPNEVVLIYYQGGEWVDDDRATHLRLGRGQGASSYDTIPIELLVGLFRDAPAAKLLLLDVTRPPGAQPDEPDPHVGLLRAAWLSQVEDIRGEGGEAWLISTLQEATSRYRTLDAVASAIRRSYGSARESHPALRLDTALPVSLSQLIIGQTAAAGEPAESP